ncbi:hypothetical protein [Embleya sp. NPDC059237]|uniref:hypothetical protein n=1 Tax=Embleya sp. NPDC059237 TaxID=3346784 RepID=UPI00367C3C26
MPLQPRFRRSAGSQRRFVDREEATAAFEAVWTDAGDGLRVVNVTGVGGIGKSRFLRECQARSTAEARTVLLDLQIPALREQDAALAVLRSGFGAQGAAFPRYDLAYLALWQRLHPHLQISLADVAARRQSDVLADLADAVGGRTRPRRCAAAGSRRCRPTCGRRPRWICPCTSGTSGSSRPSWTPSGTPS